MSINIEYEAGEKLDIPYEAIITDIVKEALEFEQCPYEAEINVVLTDNHEIRSINLEYRNMDTSTDVLSFPMLEYEIPSDFNHVEDHQEYFNPDSGELLLGDIMISVDKVEEQAIKYGHSKTRELAFLVAHSMLHLFGYDHMEEEERLSMEEKQNEILKRRGYFR